MRKLIRNRKGTAEVIGTIMAVMILMYFFANVYMWHDAATKKMDDMYVQKMNSLVTVNLMPGNTELNVTNRGGEDTQLTMLFIDSGTGPSQTDTNYTMDWFSQTYGGFTNVVPAGSSIALPVPLTLTEATVFTVVTNLGNTASCSYNP